MAGYHKVDIARGEYGKISKIQEELDELVDSEQQGNKIMVLNELSDLIGAISGYLESNFNGISLDDVIEMTKATRRAFEDGTRNG